MGALIAFGVSGSAERTGATSMSTRWAMWTLVGWVMAGISMTAQLAGSIYAPQSPNVLVAIFMATSAIILFPISLRAGRDWWKPREVLGGLLTGSLNVIVLYCTLIALQSQRSEIVFPFTVVGPIVLVQLIGQFVYREQLGRFGMVAAILGAVGLIAISAS